MIHALVTSNRKTDRGMLLAVFVMIPGIFPGIRWAGGATSMKGALERVASAFATGLFR